MIDLRSDTVTKPSAEMRRVMAEAEVGDDVYGEDPTVNRLQEMSARLTGKEAALFVASGTMANQLAVRSLTHHGDEIILERTSHPFNYESGALAAISGVQVNLVDGQRGIMELSQIEPLFRRKDHHFPPTSLIVLENTHNRGGGSIYPLDNMIAIGQFARSKRIALHLDGARIFNASVATGVPVAEYAKNCDTISFCLSKGLGCPMGSLLCGSADVIDRAHRFRKMFGGGMRQVGIIAAAGIYALENNIQRLADDHHRAKELVNAIEQVEGLKLLQLPVETNMLYFETSNLGVTAWQFVQRLKDHGVLANSTGQYSIRMVTHLDVDDDGIQVAIHAIEEVADGFRNLRFEPPRH